MVKTHSSSKALKTSPETSGCFGWNDKYLHPSEMPASKAAAELTYDLMKKKQGHRLVALLPS